MEVVFLITRKREYLRIRLIIRLADHADVVIRQLSIRDFKTCELLDYGESLLRFVLLSSLLVTGLLRDAK